MNIRPLQDKIVIKQLVENETTASGIVLPDSANRPEPVMGEVIAVGKGRMLENGLISTMSVKVGDHVAFTKYAPDEIEINGVKFLVISEDKILGIIEK